MSNNIITMTDSYKFTHWNQYPKGTTNVQSYFEARTGAKYNKTVFFGLQYLIKKHLLGQVVTREKIEQAAELSNAHFGNPDFFNRTMWDHILNNCEGRLPIRIKAVPEGLPVDINNVMMTVENTDPVCYPLTNHLETLLTHVWSSSTTATLSYEVMQLLEHYCKETSVDDQLLKFRLHDFGYRGVSSVESAAIQGAGHLLNFMGTDTAAAMELAKEYYGASYDGLAYSVPATEHSVMTSLGPDGELKLVRDLIKAYPTGILSLVIDSYNYRDFILKHAKDLKEDILARDGVTVFRPDSGDPDSVTMDVLNSLEEVFGATRNAKNYKVLNPKVGMLWGDGIDYQGIRSILFTMKTNCWAASNIVFGMGGGLLQKVNRDTQRFAFKCCAQKRDGVWYDIFKKPLDSSKKSKSGRMKLIKGEDRKFITVNESVEGNDFLQTVFENGKLIRDMTFQQCRNNTGKW